MKKGIILLIIAAVIAMPVTAFASHWGNIPLKYMIDNGYMQTIHGEANPNGHVSRLDIARAIAKLPLIDKGSNYIFVDTCDKDVVKVAKTGLLSGYGNNIFGAADNVTREEIAKAFALMLSNAQSFADVPFDDKDAIAAWAKPYVAALVSNSIIMGYENNTFRPGNYVSRAEFAVLFMKVRDAYTVHDITGNVFTNAPVQPLQFLSIPEGYVGVLNIPSLGLHELPVVEDGEDMDKIKNVAGHFINTAIFDGNVGLLGHNFTDKSPWFGKLDSINIGETIIWKTKFGIRRYTVTTRQNINAEDWSALTENGDNRITLITCLAGQSQTHRIMVQGIETQ